MGAFFDLEKEMRKEYTQNLSNPVIDTMIESVKSGAASIRCSGAAGSERAYAVSLLVQKLNRPFFAVLPTLSEAESFAQDLQFFTDGADIPILLFPPYNILPFKRIAYHNQTAAQRIRLLYQMTASIDGPAVFITPVETLLQRLIPKKELCDYAELLMVNEEIDRDELIGKLHAGGYTHAAIVEEPGDYTIRGGIIDIYSPMYPEPVRVETFGDTIDSLRLFSSVNQRKIRDVEEAIILPASEAIVRKSELPRIVERARTYSDRAGLHRKVVNEFIERIETEGVFSGIESLLPLIYPQLDNIFDYLPSNMVFVVADLPEMEREAAKKEDLAAKNYLAASNDNRLCVDPEAFYLRWSETKEQLLQKSLMQFQIMPADTSPDGGFSAAMAVDLSVEDNSDIAAVINAGKTEGQILYPLAEWIGEKTASGYLTVLVCRTQYQADRLRALLQPYDIHPEIVTGFNRLNRRSVKPVICIGRLSNGFIWHDARLAVMTEREIFGKKIKRRSRRESRQAAQAAFLDFSELSTDDLVVHMEHGIGRYQGLAKLTVEGVTNDFLLIEYRDADKLYLPVDRMGMIQKYMGVEGVVPVIDKLGGNSWQKTKEKAKKSVEKIAGELLHLYAERKVRKGYAYSSTDSYYRDFEAGFPYEETADQLRAIDEVLADMEAVAPMDRLICGDVGYGKTEVALRAAFKAVNDGKQVAVLVPTTLLAEQHYQTFAERFAKYPVNIECLSRFRSKRKQKEILENIKTGRVDIIIGTHRLLQKDIAFKDIGLIVIDEEQRFGVRHKEKLKRMRTTVDVLSMTATPIPRTLHMSLLGVRDISVISTPPELRHPIVSYISEFDAAVISEAIRKEIERGGQIFFIHNNIHTIWNMAKLLKEQVPECRLGVAHGRMDEAELEEAMVQFIRREIDMLVCTTIVESGLDIPNANTIIINRADRFGLSQIYQLRGRVGRSDEQAYAYLIVPNDGVLTREAQKRLKVLMEHSDLGAGFQIALHDLKIRGGGSALGVSQSGHIAAVGYDMFLRLMEDAVSRLKGETVIDPLEPEINVPVSVYLPESYIQDIDQRLTAYRRLSKMTELKDVADFRDELIDRYGDMPQEGTNLLLKIMLKILSTKAGVKRLDLSWDSATFAFSEAHQKSPFKILELVQSDSKRFRFTPEQFLYAQLKSGGINSLMSQTKKILIEIATYVNN